MIRVEIEKFEDGKIKTIRIKWGLYILIEQLKRQLRKRRELQKPRI